MTTPGVMTEDEETDAIDGIYSRIDDLLCKGETEAIADILDRVDIEQPTVILLAYASITTIAARSLGEHRVRYMARIRRRITETDPTRVEDLLSGLE